MNIVINKLDHVVTGKSSENISMPFGGSAVSPFFFRLLVLLSFWAYLAVWTTGYLRGMLTMIFFPLVLLGLKGKSMLRVHYPIQLLSVGALIYALWERTGSIPGVIVLLNFASVILILQLMILDTLRSANGVLVLSLMIILAVAAMNVNFIFPMVLVPYVMTFYQVLRALSIVRHQNLSASAFPDSRPGKIPYHRLVVNGVLSIAIFACFWLVIFYLIPRNESFGIASETSRRRLKGFSEILSIGEAGLLEDNPAVIMRIMPIEEKSLSVSILRRIKNKLLRGASFATYKNGKWERGTKRRWFIDTRKTDGEINLGKGTTTLRDVHQLEMILENTDPPVVFLPDQAVSVMFSVPFVSLEDDYSMYFVQRSPSSQRYLVNVLPNSVEVVDAEVTQIPRNRDLSVYSGTRGIPDKLLALAQTLASGTTTISQRVDKAVGFIQRQCTYSLHQLPSSIDPVEDFLFESKSGTCEHYATALALLLRAMDVPARPVGGYAMGDWNDIGRFFTVRQRHAHTWVEVYYPTSGWVPYDPTPSVPGDVYETELEKIMVALWETYEGYWFNYVYNFDNRAQTLGFRKISAAFSTAIGSFAGSIFRKEFLALLVLLLFLFYQRLNAMAKRAQKNNSWIPTWYIAWETKTGIERHSWETPVEFHRRLMQLNIINSEGLEHLIRLEEIIDECAFADQADCEKQKIRAEVILKDVRLQNK